MNKQPSSRFCYVCGVENPHGLHISFYEAALGEVVANVTVPADYNGYPGIVHGGVIAAMLDEAAGRAMMVDLPTGFAVTAQLNIRYRKPVQTGQPLRLMGHAGKHSGRVSNASAELFDAQGTLLATAEVVLVDIPADQVQSMQPDEMGWKVYPDDGAPSSAPDGGSDRHEEEQP